MTVLVTVLVTVLTMMVTLMVAMATFETMETVVASAQARRLPVTETEAVGEC